MKVVVIGASTNPSRISNQAVHLLDSNGHEVIAIGREEAMIGDVPIVIGQPMLQDIDTVTLYINPSIQPKYYDYICSTLAPRRVIFNPGTENGELYRKLQSCKINYEEACTLVLLRTGQF